MVRIAQVASVLLLALMALSGFAASAVAQEGALVEVTLRTPAGEPADGQVALLDADGKKVAGCKTEGGRCQMKGVAGGSYKVTVKPHKGTARKPRTVMIPPTGKVSLIVATGG